MRAGIFPSTQWQLVRRAGESEDSQAGRQAMDELLCPYWRILRGHLTHRFGMSPEDAEDVLQSFLKAKFVDRNLASRAQPGRGRFRSFLLKSLANYQVSWRRSLLRKDAVPKTGSSPGTAQEPRPAGAPESAEFSFDVEWARQVVHRALERMRQECRSQDRERTMEVFWLRIAEPLLTHTAPIPYSELQQRFGFASPLQVGNALTSGRRLFERALRAVVREYCGSEDEVREEVRELREILLHAGAAD